MIKVLVVQVGASPLQSVEREYLMTRREIRSERSRQRAEEYRRKKRLRLVLLSVGIGLYALVPVLWYGAVEFGLVRPIRTTEFKNSLQFTSLVLFLLILYFLPDFWQKRTSREKKAPPVPTTNQ